MPPGRLLRALMLEDSAVDAELIASRLELAGFALRIRRVDNERDFVEELGGEHDLILADYSLPSFSGLDALQAARARGVQIPFIFVSGVLGEEHAVEMVRRGATDYVLKQRLERLPMVVERALAEAAERRSRRRAERALRASEAGYGLLVEALRDYAVVSLDAQGRVRGWNTASVRIFGWSTEQIVGQSGSAFLRHRPDAEQLWRLELETAARDGSAGDDRWLTRRDGSLFFGSGVTTAMRDDDGGLIGFSKIVRDTTEARLSADALAAAREQAEAASRAKDHFLAVLSHELRTPLAPILLAVRLLEVRAGLPPDLRATLELIKRNVKLEARLIDDLLDLTRIVQGKLMLELHDVDLSQVLDGVLEMCRGEIDDKRLALCVQVQTRRTRVEGDAARLHQILWNMARNAAKFTAPGGSIRVRLFNPDAASVAVEVTDTGIGIAPEAIERIFASFEQAKESITQQFGGLGLGLPIARALAEMHRGALVARSDGEGRGAAFTFTVPLQQAARPAPVAMVPAAAEPQPDAGPMRVLLVEDHADTLRVMDQLIQSAGHGVTVARSVSEAERLLAGADGFDLLISDVGLPDGTGLDVVRSFRERHDASRAIALTGYGRADDVRRCLAAGFDEHLVKPVSYERLVAVLHGGSRRHA